MRQIIRWLLTALLIAAPLGIFAGSLRVVPIKVFLDDASTTASLTLTNEGEESVTVQLQAKSWDQNDLGLDYYAETRDIVFFPKILTLEPATDRIIRVGYQGDAAQAAEKTYRLFVQELPISDPGEMTLKFAVTFSIPIFIVPMMKSKDFTIDNIAQEQGQVRVTVKNGGNTHVTVDGITVKGFDAAGQQVYLTEMRGWYVLPDKTRTYDLLIPEDGCGTATDIEVEVKTGSQSIATRLDAITGQCGKSGEAPTRTNAEDGRRM